MASLPSYEESVTRLDWLTLVAPYIDYFDYYSLCVVSHRFWRVFAPRIWANLFQSARLAGIDPSDDLEWWYDLVFNKLSGVRVETRSLVRVLDARDFLKDTYDFASDETEITIQQSFRLALDLLPRVESILIDSHPDLDPSFIIGDPPPVRLGQSDFRARHSPMVLSAPHCSFKLPATIQNSPRMRALIYLDVSGVPGPLIPWIQPRNFPALRILKIRSKEIDNAMFTSLVKAFKLRLCSVDVSHNKLSDDIIDVLGEFCIPDIELRSDAAFRVEGKLVPSDQGTQTYGPFISVEESESSGAFSHPERFFIDAPMYMAQADEAPQETQAPRAYGRGPIWDDSADAVSAVVPEYGLAFEHFMPARGITHLHLSRNRVSAFGIEKLLRTSNGQIEHLACDTMSMLPLETKHLKHWPKSARLSGIVGAAHIFRPVFASNLRSLRIHHSLVTQIPTLELDGISTLARLYICENALLPRIEAAYAQAFVPDMNPRLMSLTLTCLPRRSSGPLIQRIIAFLKHLSVQECAIQDMTAVAGYRRGPGLLMGLRHLRLEFEDDAMEDGFSTSEDFDAEELLNSGEQGFSFFENERVRRLEPSGTKKKPGIQDPSNSSAGGPAKHQPVNSARDDEESVTYQGEWNGLAFSIPVWIGTKSSSIENPVLSDYRRLVVQHNLREGVGPATPGQILAGAPEKSYVFHIAWGLAIMPQQLPKPAMNDLTGMKDVLKALKTYRLAGRKKYLELAGENGNHPAPLGEPHFYWTGKLVVARTEPLK